MAILLEKGIPRDDIKIAVHDYKIREFAPEELPIQPDYWCRKHVIRSPEDDNWIHYLSHELVGLTDEEISRYYPDPEVARIIGDIVSG